MLISWKKFFYIMTHFSGARNPIRQKYKLFCLVCVCIYTDMSQYEAGKIRVNGKEWVITHPGYDS